MTDREAYASRLSLRCTDHPVAHLSKTRTATRLQPKEDLKWLRADGSKIVETFRNHVQDCERPDRIQDMRGSQMSPV